MIISLHTKGYTGNEICQKLDINVRHWKESFSELNNEIVIVACCYLQGSLVDQWIQMYEGERKRSNALQVNNEMDLSNGTNEIETGTEEIETEPENGSVASNVIEIVEYVSMMNV